MAKKNSHIIGRQVLQIEGVKKSDARQVQDRIRQTFYEKILPLLDQYLSAYAGDEIYRIEKLELDIGHIPIDQLETGWVQKVMQQLALELPQKSTPEKQPEKPMTLTGHARQLELVRFFANTGTLPWWSDTSITDPVRESLEVLSTEAPEALHHLYVQLARQAGAFQRLLRHLRYPDWIPLMLHRQTLPPQDLKLLLDILATILEQEKSTNLSRPKLKETLALQLLSWTYIQLQSSKSLAFFWKGFLIQCSKITRIDYPVFLSRFITKIEAIEKPSVIHPSSQIPEIIAALKTPEIIAIEEQEQEKESIAGKTKAKNSFNESDELLIENAGLVLLWPYLNRFFDQLGLVDKRQFVDEAAAHRAVGVLQFLAAGTELPLEHQCGLNKILCGLDWQEVLDFEEPITEAETQASLELLEAVIANANIGQMSVDGFRGSFLLRQGILRTGNGVWQLQVEQASYDVVLERVPWTWSMVKLPWMAWGMGVEW